jgi:hypothetical protein
MRQFEGIVIRDKKEYDRMYHAKRSTSVASVRARKAQDKKSDYIFYMVVLHDCITTGITRDIKNRLRAYRVGLFEPYMVDFIDLGTTDVKVARAYETIFQNDIGLDHPSRELHHLERLDEITSWFATFSD